MTPPHKTRWEEPWGWPLRLASGCYKHVHTPDTHALTPTCTCTRTNTVGVTLWRKLVCWLKFQMDSAMPLLGISIQTLAPRTPGSVYKDLSHCNIGERKSCQVPIQRKAERAARTLCCRSKGLSALQRFPRMQRRSSWVFRWKEYDLQSNW